MRHTAKEWIGATRYWSFAVSVMPAVAAFAFLCSKGEVTFTAGLAVNFALTIAGIVILHSAGNLLSDWFDFRRGVDNPQAFATPNLVQGLFEPREYLIASAICFVIGCATGIVLTLRSGWTLLAIGTAGVGLTALYSILKYNALGDLDIFLIFGVLIMLGTAYVLTGSVRWDVLPLALPVGCITVSVLHANNTVDLVTDRGSGIRTLAMVIGCKRSCVLYMIYMALPFVSVIALVICGWLHPLSLLCFAATPIAVRNFKAARHYVTLGIDAMKGLDKASSQMQMVFSGALSVGLIIASFL